MATKQSLLSGGRKRKSVEINGETVWIRELSIAQIKTMDEMEKQTDADPNTNAATYVIYSVTDDKGEPLFTPEDIEAVKNSFSLSTLKAIGDAASELNGFKKAEETDETNDTKKN